MTRPNHVSFSYISRKRGRPLNLAAESDEEANAWIAAIEQALRTTDTPTTSATTTDTTATGAAATAATSPGGATAGGGGSTPTPGAPGGTSAAIPWTAASSSAPTGAITAPSIVNGVNNGILHKEGWLLKEDPTSKMYRRRYFILHGHTLWYYEMKVKRAISLADCTLEPENTTAPTVRPLTKAQGGFAAGLNYAHRFKLTYVIIQPMYPSSNASIAQCCLFV
jgi:hypothetical protein